MNTYDSSASSTDSRLVRPDRCRFSLRTWLARFPIIANFLGLLLLAAAVFKISGLDVTSVPRVGWFLDPHVQMAAASWEVALGLCLLSGVHRLGAWLAAVATFSLFAGLTGYLGLMGASDCSCFGTIKASPWIAFGVDTAALALLVIDRPDFHAARIHFPLRGVAIIGSAICVMAILGGGGLLVYRSPQAALARLRGDPLTVASRDVDFGSGTAEQVLRATIAVQNCSDFPVRLIGGTSDCLCVATDDLPVTIPADESRPLVIHLKLTGSRGATVTRVAEFWTDHPQQRRLRLRLFARVAD